MHSATAKFILFCFRTGIVPSHPTWWKATGRQQRRRGCRQPCPTGTPLPLQTSPSPPRPVSPIQSAGSRTHPIFGKNHNVGKRKARMNGTVTKGLQEPCQMWPQSQTPIRWFVGKKEHNFGSELLGRWKKWGLKLSQNHLKSPPEERPIWISDALSRTILRQPLIYMLLLCTGFQIFQSYLLQSSNASQSYAMILIVKINNNDVLWS